MKILIAIIIRRVNKKWYGLGRTGRTASSGPVASGLLFTANCNVWENKAGDHILG